MFLLLSNDDGYQAPGLETLATALSSLGEIAVVAPDRNRSGASNSLTLDAPIRAHRASNGFYVVDGTPTDCVHLAVSGLLEREPDVIVSGINAGGNLGDDVLYSGTVAAAIEGRSFGCPAIAVSLVGSSVANYACAARIVEILIIRLRNNKSFADTLLNVNVPDRPIAELAGLRVTRLGHRHKSEPAIQSTDPQGRTIYWVGPPGEAQDAGPGTDFHAVEHGFVSITPLQLDLTRYSALETVSESLAGTELNER